eukprot:6211200-Pleurochrysis_carterae.AAC.1
MLCMREGAAARARGRGCACARVTRARNNCGFVYFNLRPSQRGRETRTDCEEPAAHDGTPAAEWVRAEKTRRPRASAPKCRRVYAISRTCAHARLRALEFVNASSLPRADA